MKTVVRAGMRFIMAEQLGAVHGLGTIDPGSRPPVAHAGIKRAFPEIKEIVTVKQVHGREAVLVDDAGEAQRIRRRRVEADIVVVSVPGVAACVRTADCTPVLILDRKRRVAAAVHAGWKGTGARGSEAAVGILVKEYGCRAKDLAAGIGPCILPCHYQVDGPVIAAIEEALGARAAEVLFSDGPGHARLDLSLANRIILEQSGVPADNISEARLCTYCHSDLFFSYRRQGKGVPSLHHFITVV